MRRPIIFTGLLLLGFIVQGQDQQPDQNPNGNSRKTRAERKAEKREKINNMIRMEEEGEPAYKKHNIFGVKFNNDGYGLSYELGKMKTPYRATIFQLEFNEKKHHKEEKQSTSDNIGGGFVVLGNPFIYGKQNSFYQLKLGIGQQLMIGGKGNKNGVGVYGVFAGGLSLGFLRPYYIEVESPPNSGFVKKIKYTAADSADFLGPFIIGGTGISSGWGEMKFVPGVHAKAALRFDWARFNNTITAIEFGFNAEFYTKHVDQMVNVESQQFFLNGYLSLIFGSRK